MWEPTNDARAIYWLDYIVSLKNRMELRDWEVTVEVEPSPETTAAVVKCVVGRKRLTVKLAGTWEKKTPEEQRQTLIHELIHAHTAHAHNLVDDPGPLLDLLGKPAHLAFYEAFSVALEYGVDALADVIAPHMPLPPVEVASEPEKPSGGSISIGGDPDEKSRPETESSRKHPPRFA